MNETGSKSLLHCLLGPKLYYIYGSKDHAGSKYRGNAIERHCNSSLNLMSFLAKLVYYNIPFIGIYLYRNDYSIIQIASLILSKQCLGSIGILMTSIYLLRALARYNNKEYCKFMKILKESKKNEANSGARNMLAQYDFDFKAWPVDYQRTNDAVRTQGISTLESSSNDKKQALFSTINNFPIEIIKYCLAHVFGRRVVYPGSTALIQMFIGEYLDGGRRKLIKEFGGKRAKLRTADGNDIDSVFVDRRDRYKENGEILVICSEGNAGYYEIGCMETPLTCGYSVLGWNHPGFANSSGLPFPTSERLAIDAVISYAISSLNFKPQNIVLYSWSIGGYCSSAGAMMYPDIKAVILDASFDHILPLAIDRMPACLSGLTKGTVTDYINLNVAENLSKYHGPVLLIRRLHDEIISIEPGDIATNRGNDLAIQLLQSRYPYLFDHDTMPVIRAWLSAADKKGRSVWNNLEFEKDINAETHIDQYVLKHGLKFPMEIGKNLDVGSKIQILLFLVTKYVVDFDSVHCTPLPVANFQMPWFHDEE